MSRQSHNENKRFGGPPQTTEDLHHHIPYLVNRLASSWNAEQNKRLGTCGINSVTLRTLSVLHIHEKLTVNEIAALAFAEQSTASRAIDAMVTSGLVERQISDQDLRRREVVLTDAGRKLLDASWPTMDEHYALMTRDIAAEEIAVCGRVLLRMIENLKPKQS
ncbi:MAG: MarR family winged helix-turn-helix transcriptional regulator [Pseudolabrys sp.]|jgi:DNA-binding MarR family transcriptional regulator